MRSRWFQFSAVVLAVLLMILPFGAVCRYISVSETSGMQHEVINTFSYFNLSAFLDAVMQSVKQMEGATIASVANLLPFWICNLAPFMCAMTAVVLLLVTVLELIFRRAAKPLAVVSITLSAAALVLSLLPLLIYGIKFYSIAAMLISFLLLCSLVIGVHRLTGKVYNETY